MNPPARKLPALFAEVRRRHVVQVGLGYMAVAFVLLQAADLLLPALGFEPWTFRVLVVLVLLGFPLTLVLAWALEIRPQPVAPAGDTVMVARATAAVPPRMRRVAVMPFTSISPSTDDEYFADGMTEELISALSRIRALDVIARTSVMRYKERPPSVTIIGRELSAGTLVEGSVRKSGDRVRIAVQLVDASTEGRLWTESYDRELTDVFAIQSDVALRIAEALEAELSREERAALLKRAERIPTGDPRAYEAYLRGRFHWYKHTPQGLEVALRHFENAVALDPNYALAHGAIADTWGARTFLGLISPRDAYPHVSAGVVRSLELDDTLAETHDMVGRLRLWFEWDRGSAERSFRRAIEIDPVYADAHIFYAWLLSGVERWEEADAQVARALEIDPLNSFFHWFRGLELLLQRRYDEAGDQFHHTLRIDAGMLLARLGLWSCLHHTDRYEEALAEARRYFDGLGDGEVLAALTAGFARAGYEGAMQAAAVRVAERFSVAYVQPTHVAQLFGYAGEPASMLEWLEKGYEQRDFGLMFAGVHPDWDAVTGEPRFQRLLQSIHSGATVP